MKLFMFYIGGDCGNSNVELHDVRFSIGETPEDCYQDLRDQWWGDPKSLHLDCWGEVRQADGHDIALVKDKPGGDGLALFFVNLGGYDPSEFCELHRNILLVAPDENAAKARALATIVDWSLPHKDNIFQIEKLVNVADVLKQKGYALALEKATVPKPFEFQCDYVPIAK